MFMSKLKSNINYRHLERAIIICHSWWQDDISCLDVSALPFPSWRAQAMMITVPDKLGRGIGHFGCVSVCRGGGVAAQVCFGPCTDEEQTGIFIMSNCSLDKRGNKHRRKQALNMRYLVCSPYSFYCRFTTTSRVPLSQMLHHPMTLNSSKQHTKRDKLLKFGSSVVHFIIAEFPHLSGSTCENKGSPFPGPGSQAAHWLSDLVRRDLCGAELHPLLLEISWIFLLAVWVPGEVLVCKK